MERCPICRGRLDAETQCRRCGADLTLASQTQAEAESLTSQAIKQMLDDNFVQSKHFLEQSLALEHNSFNHQLLKFVHQCINSNSPAHISENAPSQLLVDSPKKLPLLKRISKSFRAHS